MKNIYPIEPKRRNRFIVKFPAKFNISEFAVQKINKPKLINERWKNIRIDFIDPVAPSTSQGLFLIKNFIIDNKEKELFDIIINSLDPFGEVVEEWVIKVEKVLSINFDNLDYSDESLQKPFMVIKPFDCILKY